MNADRKIIAQPSDHNTRSHTNPPKCRLNVSPHRESVSSRMISHSPRVKRNHESSPFVLPRLRDKNAPVPASSMNVGAQKCVIQRVKKRAGVVVARFVGLMLGFMMKSRV